MHYFPIEMQWMQLHDNATYLMHYNGLFVHNALQCNDLSTHHNAFF